MFESPFHSLDLTGKTIIVTGGGSGIGRATSVMLAARGAHVAIADRDDAGGRATAAQIADSGGSVRFIRTDVTDEDSVHALVDGAVDTFGGLDGAFNNAGIAPQTHLHEATLDQWNSAIAVNLTGIFLCMKYEIAHMLDNGGGSIVNTSSLSANNTVPGMPAYIASKAGVIGLTRSASLDYARHGIRVNTILPGTIKTPMLGAVMDDPELAAQLEATMPLGDPASVAEQAAWLLSDASRFSSGSRFLVDGGAGVL